MRITTLFVFISISWFIIFDSSSDQKPELKKIFHYEQSITIEKPIKIVWEYANDINNCKNYLVFVKSVSKKRGGPVKNNTIISFHVGFLFMNLTNHYRIFNHKAPNGYSFKSIEGSSVKSTGLISIKSINKTTTKLTITFDPEITGLFKKLSDKTVDKIYNITLSNILKKIKRNIE